MKNLFRFLHIVNLLFVALTIVVHAATWGKGLSFQFWLGFYQLSLGIIQLLSLRFFGSNTKEALTIYWASVGCWVLSVGFASIHPIANTIIVIVVPMLIACYSVYVSWHALKDISNYKL